MKWWAVLTLPKKSAVACVLLLIAFALLARTAARSKSPTYDEPLHSLSGWLHLHTGEFLLDPEDPPLWKYWAMLPNGPGAIDRKPLSEFRPQLLHDTFYEWPYTAYVLYQTQPNASRSDTIIARGRDMMLIVAVALGVAIALWTWRLAGAGGAVIATALFAFDPNFLGHGSLVKNDVALSLAYLGAAWAIWRIGKRVTVWNVTALAIATGAALNIKFSALLLGPVIVALLVMRALLNEPWTILGREAKSRLMRLAAAGGIALFVAYVGWMAIWACYGFRFRPAPEPDAKINFAANLQYAAINEYKREHNGQPAPPEYLMHWRPHGFPRLLQIAHNAHLLPDAWLNGLLFTWHSALVRKTFLLGEYSVTGWWYYFPFAMVVKSTIGLLIALLAAATIAAMFIRRLPRQSLGTAACLAIPPAVYLLAAMRSNLNLGLRHVLPVFPFLFIAIALAASAAIARWRRPARIVAAVLVASVVVESLAAFPDYIPFFNAAAGGSRGGLRLLGDSNLDWGQDLKLLSAWQQDHPGTRLYLCYFGFADPQVYGIDYINLPGGYQYGPPFGVLDKPGVIAISATHLQGIYHEEAPLRKAYGNLRNQRPREVLGGTIYLYDWPLRP